MVVPLTTLIVDTFPVFNTISKVIHDEDDHAIISDTNHTNLYNKMNNDQSEKNTKEMMSITIESDNDDDFSSPIANEINDDDSISDAPESPKHNSFTDRELKKGEYYITFPLSENLEDSDLNTENENSNLPVTVDINLNVELGPDLVIDGDIDDLTKINKIIYSDCGNRDRSMLNVTSRNDLHSYKSSKKLFISAFLNGYPVKLMIDTGSDISTINNNIVNRDKLLKLPSLGGDLYFADGSSIPRPEFVDATVTYQGQAIKLSLDILDTSLEFDGICGLDLLNSLGASISFPVRNPALPEIEIDILHPEPHHELDIVNNNLIFNSLQSLLTTNASIKHTCNHPACPIRIPTIPGKVPGYSKEFKANPVTLAALTAWRDRAIASDIITKASLSNYENQYNNSIFPVWHTNRDGKKDFDKEPRIVLNPKFVNECMIIERFPIPNIQVLRENMMKYRYFAELDLAKAFNQLPLHEEDQHKTSFMVDGTRYQFKVLQFGLANGTAVFQKIMKDIFKDFVNVSIYVDNILIGADSVSQLQDTLHRVIDTLNKFNLKLNIAKSTFCATTINVLGAAISHMKVSITEDMMAEAASTPFPTSHKQLHSLIGFAGFMRNFIPKYVEIMAPLENLLLNTKDRSLAEFRKLASHHVYTSSFQEFKEAVAKPLTLNAMDPDIPLAMITDASDYGISAILFQQVDSSLPTPDNIIAIYTLKLTTAQQRYDACKKELFALIAALKHWSYLLIGNRFLIISDSQALTWTNAPQNRISHQWFDFLLQFDYNIIHVPGKENFLADFLSRIHKEDKPLTKPPHSYDSSELDQQICAVRKANSIVIPTPPIPTDSSELDQQICAVRKANSIAIPTPPIPTTPIPLIPKEFLYYVQKDLNSKKYFRTTFENYEESDTSFESKHFHFSKEYIMAVPSAQEFFDKHHSKTEFFYLDLNPVTLNDPFNDHVIPYTYPNSEEFVYTPSSIANLMRQQHGRGHFSEEAMILALRTKGFYWPNMTKDIMALCRHCPICAAHNPIRRMFSDLHSSRAYAPWRLLQMDLCVSFEKSNSEFKYLLVVVDIFTDLSFAFPLKTKDAPQVAGHIKLLMLQFGIPLLINTDGGGEFDNLLLSEIFECLRIEHHISIPYYYQGHGKVESKIKTIYAVIKKMCGEDTTNWASHINQALLMVNLKVNSFTNLSPFQLFFNRDYAASDDTEVPKKHTQEDTLKWMETLATTSTSLFPLVNRALEVKRKKANINFRKTHNMAKPNEFNLGDLVFIKSPTRVKKSLQICEGPFKITEIFENNSFGLSQGEVKHERRVPISELKHFQDDKEHGDSTISLAKKIIAHKGSESKRSYQVLWKDDSTSWEPANNILNRSLITNYFLTET